MAIDTTAVFDSIVAAGSAAAFVGVAVLLVIVSIKIFDWLQLAIGSGQVSRKPELEWEGGEAVGDKNDGQRWSNYGHHEFKRGGAWIDANDRPGA